MIAPSDRIGYRALADLLRGQIISGALAPGARFPSETDLRQTYGCGRGTVRNAVALLREEGLIVVRHGSPTHVAEEPVRTEVRVSPGARLYERRATMEEREHFGTTMVTVVEYLGEEALYGAGLHVFVYR